MPNVLVIRPTYDEATQAIAPWAEDVLSLVPAAPDLSGAGATRPAVEQYLPAAQAVAFYGHGTAIALLGEHGPLITLVDALTGRLAGKMMFAVACYSGGLLGWMAVARGATLYIGHTRPFYLWDEVNPIFRQLANGPLIRMVRTGETAEQAVQLTRDAYEAAIDLFLFGDGSDEPNAPAIAADLRSNADSLVLRGNRGQKI